MAEKKPWSGVIAQVAFDTLAAALDQFRDEDDELIGDMALIRGSATHHALVEYQPGDMVWAQELAQKLSIKHPGKHHAFGRHPEYEWVSSYERGKKIADAETAIEPIAEKLGVAIFPKAPRTPRSYLVVESATPEEVARALGGAPAPKRHLEKSALNTIGWTEGGNLSLFAEDVSKALNTRAYSIKDGEDRFAVRIFESGVERGRFEADRSSWGDALRVDDVLGASDRETILAKLGIKSAD